MSKIYYIIISILLILIIAVCSIGIYFFSNQENAVIILEKISGKSLDGKVYTYEVFQSGKKIKSYNSITDAVSSAQKNGEDVYIKNTVSDNIIWSSNNETSSDKDIYAVYKDGNELASFLDYNSAIEYASNFQEVGIIKNNESDFVWNNFPQYSVFINKKDYVEFFDLQEALEFAKSQDWAYVYYIKTNSLIYTTEGGMKESYMIQNVPKISQLPELERGCEVTSLSMLLNFAGINVSKLTLAEEIKKDPTPYKVVGNEIFYGNPNDGFVGDIYTTKNPGLGVYHTPVFELTRKYLGNNAIDITGSSLEDVLYFVGMNTPVWVIINTNYDQLPDSYFQTWNTPSGKINITYKEHSVVITGYDKTHVYIVDPLNPITSVEKEKFNNAFIQMGSQAITYTN